MRQPGPGRDLSGRLLAELTLSELFMEAFLGVAGMDDDTWLACSIASSQVDTHLIGAHAQVDRMSADHIRWKALTDEAFAGIRRAVVGDAERSWSPTKDTETHEEFVDRISKPNPLFVEAERAHALLWADMHFYLVCWHTIARLMRLVEKRLGIAADVSVCQQYRSELDLHAKARHDVEHMEQRLPGEPREADVQIAPQIKGNYWHWQDYRFLVFRDRKIDVSAAGAAVLDRIVSDFREMVRADLMARIHAR